MDKLFQEILNTPQPWYRRWFPWLPIVYRIPTLRLFVFLLKDCSYTAISILKPHSLDGLRANHGKQRWVGFQFWY